MGLLDPQQTLPIFSELETPIQLALVIRYDFFGDSGNGLERKFPERVQSRRTAPASWWLRMY